jgi:HAD superfamily hydrolase (TIGR01484 family)
MPRLQPLSAFSVPARRRVRVVLCDIDDTLTTDGHLTASAYAAIEALARAGFAVVPVTGRPAGWCDLIARLWPVAGVVGENGAFYFHYARAERRVVRRYWQDAEERRRARARLDALALRLLEAVPGAGIASDQAYRETDLAIDWREDVAALPPEAVSRLIELARAEGATVKLSSIHINIWFGEFDKLRMTRRLLREVFDADPDVEPGAFVFVGDSPNDAPMFGFFPNAIGVANVLDFRGRIESEPTYVTQARGGDGFAEVGRALLEARG